MGALYSKIPLCKALSGGISSPVYSGPGARAFPKDARLGLPTRPGIRRDYYVVPPHYLREPSGLAINPQAFKACLSSEILL